MIIVCCGKLIIQRPSLDHGNGVAYWSKLGMDVRLYYWASVVGIDPCASIYDDQLTRQFPHESDRSIIIVHVPQGFRPERKKIYIRVGALPYPMAWGYDFKKAIHFYRNDYVNFLYNVMTKSNIAGIAADTVKRWFWDGTADAALSHWVTLYGQVIELEVYAKAPPIVGLTINQANVELKMRNLTPHLAQKVYNPDKRLHGRVKKIVGAYGLRDGNRLRAGTQVSYEVYTSTLSGDHQPQPVPPTQQLKEICGDGIDNNRNNQIDEGCYSKEIIVDDNQCRDDTIGLIIDGKYLGNTPSGNKRSYNVQHLGHGYHKLQIVGVHSIGKARGCADNDVISYGVKVSKGMTIDKSRFKIWRGQKRAT